MTDKYDEMAREIETAVGGTYEMPDGRAFWIDGPVAREITRRVMAASALRQVERETLEQGNRKPDGYAYIYPWPFGGEVIRFSNGEEYNGHKPLRAVPYWLESSPPSPTPTEDVPTPTELVDREYVRVPREPTLEMMRAAAELVGYPGTKEKYIAMIQAAHEIRRQEKTD